jgi:hypothetical protein
LLRLERSLPEGMLSDRSFYADHFMDLQLWQPRVTEVCHRLGLACERVTSGLPGSFPTFIASLAPGSAWPNVVVKFFGPLFDGHACFLVELGMGNYLRGNPLPIASPAILMHGWLDDDWGYLVFEHVPGMSLGEARQLLSAEALHRLARQLGGYMRALHSVPADTLPAVAISSAPASLGNFRVFLEHQWEHCLAYHRQWDDLPAHLLAQLPDYVLPPGKLLDPSTPPHLLHADLTADHLLGRLIPPDPAAPLGSNWESLAVIDWGDARLGNILYELVAVYVDLFHGDRHLLHSCLESYGLSSFFQQDFPRKALSMLLLHQFPIPASFYALHHECVTLEQLAERLFA